VDVLSLTHVDKLHTKIGPWKVCLSYEYTGSERALASKYFDCELFEQGSRVRVNGIIFNKERQNKTHDNSALSRLLFDCKSLDFVQFDTVEGIPVLQLENSNQCSSSAVQLDYFEEPIGDFLTFVKEKLGASQLIVSLGPTFKDKVWLQGKLST